MAACVSGQGGIIAITFDTGSGHEQKGRRPAMVVSKDLFNRSTGLAIVCPVTNAEGGFPFHVPVPKDSKLTGFIPYLLTAGCRVIEPGEIDGPACGDPDDDEFPAAAPGGKADAVLSGDKHLLDVNGYTGIEVIGPSEFIEKYLSERSNAEEQSGS